MASGSRGRRWLLAISALLWAQPAWLAPRRTALRLAGISTALWGASCEAEEFGAPGRKVLDLAGLLPSSTEKELEKAIGLLEQDTPYRFRLVTPPAGYGPEDKFGWSDFVKNVGRYFAQDVAWDAGNAVVLVVSPRAVAGRQANPLNFSVATKLTQKLQYRIASDTFSKISNRYGDTQLVGRVGEGEAASLAALNAIACLRKGVCMQPLSDAWRKHGETHRDEFRHGEMVVKNHGKKHFLLWWEMVKSDFFGIRLGQ
eukprot:s348_g34.t1